MKRKPLAALIMAAIKINIGQDDFTACTGFLGAG